MSSQVKEYCLVIYMYAVFPIIKWLLESLINTDILLKIVPLIISVYILRKAKWLIVTVPELNAVQHLILFSYYQIVFGT